MLPVLRLLPNVAANPLLCRGWLRTGSPATCPDAPSTARVSSPASLLVRMPPFEAWLTCLLTESLAAPVGLSGFARAALSPAAHTADMPCPSNDLWPCPPPTVWRWTGPKPSPRKRKVIARQVLTSKLLRLVVCALNWQALGHPLLPPPAACLGAL